MMRFNVPPVTRALIILESCCTLSYGLARYNAAPTIPTGSDSYLTRDVPYLTLTPSKFYYYPWTIFTSTFVEQNIVNLLLNVTAVLFCGRYLERAWGSKDFGIMILIAIIIPNLLLIPTYIIWGAILRNATRADTPIAGAVTLQAAFMVCFKQLIPEHTVSLYKGLVKTRVKHGPAILLAVHTIGGIVVGTDTALLLAWYGLITTYLYLRFFRYQQEVGLDTSGNMVKGDASETFAFATFFPTVIQPPIAAICDQIYILACNLKLITPFSDEAIASSNEQAAARGEGSLPTVSNQARAAAERRRQLALKALDERLNAASSQSQTITTTDANSNAPGQP